MTIPPPLSEHGIMHGGNGFEPTAFHAASSCSVKLYIMIGRRLDLSKVRYTYQGKTIDRVTLKKPKEI